MTRSTQRLVRCLLLFGVGLVGGGCDSAARPPVEPSFAVTRAKPGAADARVFLNQAIVVYFSAPVDPLTVTTDTVRVLDEQGHPVTLAAIEVGSQSISLQPRPPTTAELDDGSFRPGARYRIDVAGYPRTNAVRSRAGRILSTSFATRIVAVDRGGTAEYPWPMLPVGIGDEPFAIDPTRRLDVLAQTGVLEIHFSLPPNPPSVTPRAFVVQRWDDGLRPVPISRVVVRSDASDRHPGSTVEIHLGEPVSADDILALFVEQTGPDALVDYRGRPLVLGQPVGSPLRLQVRPGAHLHLLTVEPDPPPILVPQDAASPGFEVRDRSRFSPAVRMEAGDGRHGLLSPSGDSGLDAPVDGILRLSGLSVPAGVRLVIRHSAPLKILVAGTIEVAGELVVDTPRGPPVDFAPGRSMTIDELLAISGCVLVAAGDVTVDGRLAHANELVPGFGPPVALVCGGELRVDGRIPPRAILAPESGMRGQAQAAEPVRVRLRPGWAGARPVVAAAWTPWYPVPDYHRGKVACRALEPRGGFEVLVQVAPPHPIDAGRIDGRRELWSAPVPAEVAFAAAPGSFVRFLLRARVAPGTAELPAAHGVALLAR